MRFDLHCHTRHSDGLLSPAELVALARVRGLAGLAVTDHDTVAGLAELPAAAGGPPVIPGVELSAFDPRRERKVHVVGLFLDGDRRGLEAFCATVREQRVESGREAFRRVVAAGYGLEWEAAALQAADGRTVYRTHILQALLAAGHGRSDPAGLSRRLFAEGREGAPPGLAFVPIRYPRAVEAVEALRRAGGLPILAHPGLYGNFEALPELVEAGLQGIEVWHPSHSAAHRVRAMEEAERFDLAWSGGSDFHGEPHDEAHELGRTGIGQEELDEIVRRRASRG